MLTRRDFIKLTGASTIGWYVATQTGWVQWAVAQVPSGTLEPESVSKYVTPLLIPPVMPRAGTITLGGKPADYYEISMRQISQQILPAGFPETTVWGYGAIKSASDRGLLMHNAPSLTIEAKWNRPVRVKWINDLVHADGTFRPTCCRGPDAALGEPARWRVGPRHPPHVHRDPRRLHRSRPDRDARPRRRRRGRRERRYAEAWYLPAAGDIPERLRDRGHLVRLLRGEGRLALRRHVGTPGSPPSSTRTRTASRSGTTTTRSA